MGSERLLFAVGHHLEVHLQDLQGLLVSIVEGNTISASTLEFDGVHILPLAVGSDLQGAHDAVHEDVRLNSELLAVDFLHGRHNFAAEEVKKLIPDAVRFLARHVEGSDLELEEGIGGHGGWAIGLMEALGVCAEGDRARANLILRIHALAAVESPVEIPQTSWKGGRDSHTFEDIVLITVVVPRDKVLKSVSRGICRMDSERRSGQSHSSGHAFYWLPIEVSVNALLWPRISLSLLGK
mmetsp:Transcript_22914/g.40981  ORF Transcript_22914/g.40981 Transcript_22914/m.40981 type:complete len:239 (-) Transcript_22914:157-873(-)